MPTRHKPREPGRDPIARAPVSGKAGIPGSRRRGLAQSLYLKAHPAAPMDRDWGSPASNATPRGSTMPAAIITPIISGVTQRTGHEIAYTATFTNETGGNMRAVGGG